MTDNPADKKNPPPGVIFMRDEEAKNAEFKKAIEEMMAQARADGSLTPAWESFLEKALQSQRGSEDLWKDFFALLAAEDSRGSLTEEEVEALLASTAAGSEPS